MSKPAEDLTGREFGRLRVLHRVESPKDSHGPLWACLCDPALGGCGKEKTIAGRSLRPRKGRRMVLGCGCQVRAKARANAAASAAELVGQTLGGMAILSLDSAAREDGEAMFRVCCPKGAEHVVSRHDLHRRETRGEARCYYCPGPPKPEAASKPCSVCGKTFATARAARRTCGRKKCVAEHKRREAVARYERRKNA